MDSQYERTTAKVVAAVLRDIVARPHRAHLSASGNVVMIGPWQLIFQIKPLPIGLQVLEAVRPTGCAPVSWELGCERDDWSKGPESQVVTPEELLSPSERADLVETVLALEVEPAIDICPMGPPLDAMERKAGREAKCRPGPRPKFENPWSTPDPVVRKKKAA